MRALDINILLHYRTSPVDYSSGGYAPPEISEAIGAMLGELDLLDDDTSEEDRAYCLSERGEVYTDALLSVPLPICTWSIPES